MNHYGTDNNSLTAILTASQRQILNFLLHYICLTALVTFQIAIFIPFPSSENQVSPKLAIFNVCDKLKDVPLWAEKILLLKGVVYDSGESLFYL